MTSSRREETLRASLSLNDAEATDGSKSLGTAAVILSAFTGYLDRCFKISERGSSIQTELFCGFVHYMSCFYILSVIPNQLEKANYSKTAVFVVTCICTGLGSIACGLISNLPIIIAPPTSVAIFFSDFLRQNQSSDISTSDIGNLSNIIASFFLILMVLRPINDFVAKCVPLPIQVGTTVGIGLITSLAGATDLNLIVQGQYTLLSIASITATSSQFFICFSGLFIIVLGLHYHWKSTFMVSFTFCAMLFWLVNNAWPTTIIDANPVINSYVAPTYHNSADIDIILRLAIDMSFLSILYLNGLIQAHAGLAKLENEDGSVPGGNWVYLICGASTVLSGVISGAPVLVSPESAAGIKAGARTGLSAIVGGMFFLLSVFFAPLFAAVPVCATSQILIIIGAVLFQNVLKLEWYVIKDAAPAFLVLFFIPMAYNILDGLIIGYLIYCLMEIFTGAAKHDLAVLFGFAPEDEDVVDQPTPFSIDGNSVSTGSHLSQHRRPRIVMNMGYPEMLMDTRIRQRQYTSRPMSNPRGTWSRDRYPSRGLFSDPGNTPAGRSSMDVARGDAVSVSSGSARMSFPSVRSSVQSTSTSSSLGRSFSFMHPMADSWTRSGSGAISQSILPRQSAQAAALRHNDSAAFPPGALDVDTSASPAQLSVIIESRAGSDPSASISTRPSDEAESSRPSTSSDVVLFGDPGDRHDRDVIQ